MAAPTYLSLLGVLLFTVSLALAVPIKDIYCNKKPQILPPNTIGFINCGSRTDADTPGTYTFLAPMTPCKFNLTAWNTEIQPTFTLHDGDVDHKRQVWSGFKDVGIASSASSPLLLYKTDWEVGPTKSFNFRGLYFDCGPVFSPKELTSGQPLSESLKSGLSYYSLGAREAGLELSLSVTFTGYKGIQLPQGYIATNRVPTLESYDFTNTSVSVGKNMKWLFTQKNPKSGLTILAIMSSAPSANATLTGTWMYNYETIQLGKKLTKTVTAATRWCGQLVVSNKLPKMVIQVARQSGTPVFSVGMGTPSVAKYVLDTNKEAFLSVEVESPYNPTAPNPGYWYICTQPGFAGGFVVSVDKASI